MGLNWVFNTNFKTQTNYKSFQKIIQIKTHKFSGKYLPSLLKKSLELL